MNETDVAFVVGHPKTVLEVGSGDPMRVSIAKDRGAEVVHVERIHGDGDGGLSGKTFDLVLLGRSSESDRGAVARVAGYIADGGRLVVDSSTALLDDVRGAGLEVLVAAPTLIARRTPARRPLSLAVGMISMNEEGAVGAVIDDIKRHAPSAEVLLVDSSKDKTAEIAESKGARVIKQFPPRGYGPAMFRLLYEATADVILTMDCDGTYPADRILELHKLVEDGADLVNATRTRQRPKTMPFANFLANRVFAATAYALHGLPTTDVHSGMRAYRTSMLRGIDVYANAAALPVDLMIVPARLGYRIVEVEIPYFERVGATTLHRFDSTKWTFRRMARTLSVGKRARRERWTTR